MVTTLHAVSAYAKRCAIHNAAVEVRATAHRQHILDVFTAAVVNNNVALPFGHTVPWNVTGNLVSNMRTGIIYTLKPSEILDCQAAAAKILADRDTALADIRAKIAEIEAQGEALDLAALKSWFAEILASADAEDIAAAASNLPLAIAA